MAALIRRIHHTRTEELPLVDATDFGNELVDPAIPCEVSRRYHGQDRTLPAWRYSPRDKSRAVYLAGGAGMVMYNNSDDDNLATDSHWVPSVHIDQTPGLAIKAYIAADLNQLRRSSKVSLTSGLTPHQ